MKFGIRVTVKTNTGELRVWQDAAAREGLTLHEWLRRAAELAVARGSTR